MKYSAIIPVYNESSLIEKTISKTADFFESKNLKYEIILVNDGSSDDSWNVIKKTAKKNKNIKGVNLLKNYGQHSAVICGLNMMTGDYAITLDSDLQNPPGEIIHLINKAKLGHDLVMGSFIHKKHSLYRKMGTKFIWFINKRIFDVPDGIVMTNFRIIRSDVVKRMCNYKTNFPYIQGLAIKFSENPANVKVKHNKRITGKSHYTFLKLVSLTARIMFSYSSYPLRIVSLIGLTISISSFLLAAYFVIKALFFGTSVAGWASIAVLLSIFNGITLLILGMLGEYVLRVLNQTSERQPYYIKEKIN